METDSSDEDSTNSIPRPIYETLSAIESPQPAAPLSDSGEMEAAHNKRLKYVVSAPATTTNSNSSSSSSLSTNSPAIGSGHSLTMKISKVPNRLAGDQQTKTSPGNATTLKQGSKARATRELLALKKSHDSSKVLTTYVAVGSKLKRRKSRAVGSTLDNSKQSADEALSISLPTQVRRGNGIKRSKSIAAPVWDSDEEWHHEAELLKASKSSAKKKRGHSVAYDAAEMNKMSNSDTVAKKFRSRSKTFVFSKEERVRRRSNLRSENEEFAKKHSAFLDRVINDSIDEPVDMESAQEPSNTLETEELPRNVWRTSLTADTDANLSMQSAASELKPAYLLGSTNSISQLLNDAEETGQRLNQLYQAPPRDGWDPFCWKCRECGKLVPCCKCLRSFHMYCVRPASTKFDSSWKCPECALVESAPKRLRRNDVSVDLLSQLLSFALDRMKNIRGVYKLRSPEEVLPQNYRKYFVNPVTFASLSERIKNHAFHTVEEFLGEVKWLQHNALILDSGDSKVEQAAKAVVKVCRQEANEIDTCAECYLNANSSDEWFVKVCTQPHLLLWAKLKGFPYWPAKAMGFGTNSLVNVRFFGKHDRANVPVKECYLYSVQDPNSQTSRRSARDLAECIREVEVHIEQIKRKIGGFNYAPYRTPYDPLEEQQQLEQMMPGVHNCVQQQLAPANKTPLQFLIRKTAGDKLSIVKKNKTAESGNESDHSSNPNKPTKPIDIMEVVKEPAKERNSNYEVIPKLADPLCESRGCTVILKRKSLEVGKSTTKQTEPRQSTETPQKRKHSLSDVSCSSETSNKTEHKQKPKHARKHLEEQSEKEEEGLEKFRKTYESSAAAVDTQSEPAAEVTTTAILAAAENPTCSVFSAVELIRKRQGVTITKISRDQQQAKPSNEPVRATEEIETVAADGLEIVSNVKQREMERQQQQLISKVVPFVLIKTEQLSEPEDEAASTAPANDSSSMLATEPVPQPEQIEAATVTTNTTHKSLAVDVPPEPVAANVNIAKPAPMVQIKEEVISDDETETTGEHNNQKEPNTSPTAQSIVREVPSASAAPVTPANDCFVHYLGDTTIQRLHNKQILSPNTSPANKTQDLSPRRSGLRGMIHGPLPAAASPAHLSIAKTASSTPNNTQRNCDSPQHSPILQPQKSPANQQSLRVKSDKALNATLSTPSSAMLPPSTTSSLLRSHMVVIPVDAAQPQHLPRNANGSSGNLTAIPVPPLTAVSKNTLQNSTAALTTAVGSVVITNSMPPPPLAGLTLTGTQPTATTVVSNAEPSPLANALNGISNETLPTQSAPPPPSETVFGESMTQSMATALSEILLRNGPPKLVPRPRGPLQSDGSNVFPAQAGPVSQRLKENAHKITDYFITVIEDTVSDMGTGDNSLLQARLTSLTLENERIKLHYERQLAENQRNSDLIISEVRKTKDIEIKRAVNEVRQQCIMERNRAVEETKRKQWCANCLREAQLYCCWNTSYCDYPCQQMHWARHSINCGQATNMTAPRVQSPQSQPLAQPQLHMDISRGKHKNATTVSYKAPAATTVTAVAGNKKWHQQQQQQMPLISVIGPSNTEVLKLPTNTYLRPVNTMPPTSTTITNNIVATGTLITPTPHHQNAMISGQRNVGNNYGSKAAVPTLPVQRYNIPLPITQSNNATYALMHEQQQKAVKQNAGRNTGKANNRGRAANNNNNTNAQGMRQNQMSHIFQQ